MKRKAGLVLTLLLFMLTGMPVHAKEEDDPLAALKESMQTMNLEPEELTRKAQELYDEYGTQLADMAQELYAEYGDELTQKAMEIYEEQKETLADKAGELYEEKASQLAKEASQATNLAQEKIKKSVLDSIGDFFSDMAVTVGDFFKGLFR